jgi:hypothetical protein
MQLSTGKLACMEFSALGNGWECDIWLPHGMHIQGLFGQAPVGSGSPIIAHCSVQELEQGKPKKYLLQYEREGAEAPKLRQTRPYWLQCKVHISCACAVDRRIR